MQIFFQRQYLILAFLFTAKVVPTIFFMMALPVILRLEGFSLKVIGLLQLSALPYMVKFLWAPLLDRGGAGQDHYKRWTFASGLVYGILLIVLGCLDLRQQFNLVVVLVMLISVVASTQDISISSLYIKLLSFEERGAGSSTKILAVNLGSILGSGFFLLIYNHFDWQACLSGMGALVLAALIPLARLEEGEKNHGKGKTARWTDIFSFFRETGMVRWFILILFNSVSISAVYFMLKPFLVDKGVDTDVIAFLVGFYGMGIAALASMATGCRRFQKFLLARRISYLAGVMASALAVAVFIPIALAAGTTVLFCFAVALINMALTVSSVINATLVMDFSRPGLESVDYSLQMTGIHLGGLAMSAVSGMIVASVGYRMFFVNQTLFACLMFPVSLILFRGSWIPGAGPDTSG